MQAAKENMGYMSMDVEAEEWIVGGRFTGFSSEQGYGIIVNILRGEKTLSELDD